MKLMYLPNSDGATLNTRATIDDLKASNTDFEWYPTTNRMIEAVIADALSAGHCNSAASVLDIGAGDGRVLAAFKKEEKLGLSKFYGIEKSPNHVARWSADYTFIGGDFYENDISSSHVGITFSNPPYSSFERWTEQLIKSSYSTVIYLVLPRRWKESKRINTALAHRGLSAEVILTDDFTGADRKARAVVDVVRVISDEYNKPHYKNGLMGNKNDDGTISPYSFLHHKRSDPMDVWFDEAFPNMSKMKKSQSKDHNENKESVFGLFKKTNTIDDLVMLYQLEADRVLKNYQALDNLDVDFFTEMNINLSSVKEILKKRMNDLRGRFWSAFIHNYEPITCRLTKKYQEKIYENLIDQSRGIPFNAINALIVTQMVIKMANEYSDAQVTDFFYELSNPKYTSLYKSNQKVFLKNNWRYCKDPSERANRYTLDYRIIQSCLFGLRLNVVNRFEGYDVNNVLTDICVIAKLVGIKLPHHYDSKEFVGSDVAAGERVTINYRPMGSDEETELFAIKFFANQNQHIYLSKEFAMRLNIYIGRLLGWVSTAAEAYEEMGIKTEDRDFFVSTFDDTRPTPMQFSNSGILGYLGSAA